MRVDRRVAGGWLLVGLEAYCGEQRWFGPGSDSDVIYETQVTLLTIGEVLLIVEAWHNGAVKLVGVWSEWFGVWIRLVPTPEGWPEPPLPRWLSGNYSS